MLIHLKSEGYRKQQELCDVLSQEGFLCQLTEECRGLILATHGVRRALNGTTLVSLDDAQVKLIEKCADALLCIDYLAEIGLVDRTGMQYIGRYKNDRWYDRVLGERHEA